MRELTWEELELVAGGGNTVDGVTVIAPPGDGGGDGFDGGYGGYGGDGGDGGGGGGGDGGNGHSAAANAFASQHVHLANGADPNDPHTAAIYKAEESAFASAYDLAQTNPNQVISEPNGATTTAAAVYTQMSIDNVHIGANQTTPWGAVATPDGADTYHVSSTDSETYIDPNSAGVNNPIAAFGQDAGANFAVYHELGHTMPDSYQQGMAADAAHPGDPSYREGIATEEGAALAASVGAAYPTDAQLNAAGVPTHTH